MTFYGKAYPRRSQQSLYGYYNFTQLDFIHHEIHIELCDNQDKFMNKLLKINYNIIVQNVDNFDLERGLLIFNRKIERYYNISISKTYPLIHSISD